MPPPILIRIAIAVVWIYEGLWCKVLSRRPEQKDVAALVPFVGPAFAQLFLIGLGVLECAFGVWTLSGWQLWWAALVQTLTLAVMNTCGLTWARRNIHDPGGMLAKNFVFVILMWVAAGLRGA
ncbi:MAG TPA: DoxX-like family protein [Acidobacteriaceae bacterium]|nr:DoxX-like family protein [Acidobacteriaceae bacterium]